MKNSAKSLNSTKLLYPQGNRTSISNTIEYKGTTSSSSESSKYNRRTVVDFRFRRDGKFLDIEFTTKKPDSDPSTSLRSRITINEDFKVHYQLRGNPDQIADAKPQSAIVWEEARDFELLQTLAYGLQYGTWLDGYLATDGTRLVESLLLSDDLGQIEPEEGDSHQLVGIAGTTPYGRISLTIDKDRGYLPVVAKIEKKASDFAFINLLVSETPVDPTFGGGLVAWSAEVRDVKFRQTGENWILESGQLKIKESYKSGEEQILTYSTTRTDLMTNPSFADDAFAIDLPRKSVVSFEDEIQSGLPYEWDGEKPIVVTGDSPSPAIGSFGRSSSWKLGFVVVNLLLFGGTTLWLIFKKRSA